jgi:hypothetical protein
MTYAHADLDTKQQALTQAFPDHLEPNNEPLPAPPAKLTDWLTTLLRLCEANPQSTTTSTHNQCQLHITACSP